MLFFFVKCSFCIFALQNECCSARMDEFAFSSSAKRASSACAYDGHGSFFGLTNADSPDGRRLTLLDILRLTDLSSFCINRERPFNEDPLNRGKRWGSGLPRTGRRSRPPRPSTDSVPCAHGEHAERHCERCRQWGDLSIVEMVVSLLRVLVIGAAFDIHVGPCHWIMTD